MDYQTFQAKYGYAEQPQNFKGGARAGVIVASVLSALATLVSIFINIVAMPIYYGEPTLSVLNFMPLLVAALMVVMAGVVKPKSKIVLAIPVTVWTVFQIAAFVRNISSLVGLGYYPVDMISTLWSQIPLYPLIVTLLMWLTCANVIKNGKVGGVIITVTAVLGFFISFVGSFFSLIEAIDYNPMVVVIISMNIFSAAAGMLLYIANAAALFMIGSKPKVTPYYYAPTPVYAQPVAQNYPNAQPPVEPTQPPVEPTQPDNDNSEVQ